MRIKFNKPEISATHPNHSTLLEAPKTAVVDIKNRNTGTIQVVLVPETTAARLEHFIEFNIVKDANVCADENKVYNSNLHNHKTVNHVDEEYVRVGAHNNGIKSFWTLQSTGTTEHFIASITNISSKINEFSERFNILMLLTRCAK